MKKLVLGLLSLTLLVTACKKSKDAPAINKENISGTYKLTEIMVSMNGSAYQSADFRAECAKDDLYKLNADNSFNYVDAGIVCNPAGDLTGTWALDGTVLSSNNINGTISKFDGSSMEVTVTSTDQGTTSTWKSTFVKQ